jgi:hypothetical protein
VGHLKRQRTILLVLGWILAVGVVGCRTDPPVTQRLDPRSFGLVGEREIFAVLKEEPVPLPRTTPYDADSRQRQVYLDGFRIGWPRAISGSFLHDVFGVPSDRICMEGSHSGFEMGLDRWHTEELRLRAESDIRCCAGEPDT